MKNNTAFLGKENDMKKLLAVLILFALCFAFISCGEKIDVEKIDVEKIDVKQQVDIALQGEWAAQIASEGDIEIIYIFNSGKVYTKMASHGSIVASDPEPGTYEITDESILVYAAGNSEPGVHKYVFSQNELILYFSDSSVFHKK